MFINYKMSTITFESLDLPISENIYNKDEETQKNIFQYLKQINDKERKAYLIAKEHLGTSFNILKSVGFIEWKKNK